MQYHALSIASHGGKVNFIGYVESEVHPDVLAHRFIDVTPIRPFPKLLQSNSKLLFFLLAPLKVIWQTMSLYYALGYRVEASKWMLVQNPPSIPTLAMAQFICFFRRTRLVIDWHNFGYSILSLKLGSGHAVVRLSERYERFFSKGAVAHFVVTNAMARVLKQNWAIQAITLHDRPPVYFQPLTSEQRFKFLQQLPETQPYVENIEKRTRRLIVSSTSWTIDEDFSILLDALVEYSTIVENNKALPRILVLITGKGPQRESYVSKIRELNRQNRLLNVVIITAWLSSNDYASLLGAADLGVSLHTSSSGVDLPMKVVDMFGAGLPVVGWDKFEAWSELVREGENGYGFGSSKRLTELLQELFSQDGVKLRKLKEGALRESARRWEDEWMPKAGQLFQLRP